MPEQKDIKTLLQRWQKEMDRMSSPVRPYLMFHLSNIGMKGLHDKSVFDFSSNILRNFALHNV